MVVTTRVRATVPRRSGAKVNCFPAELVAEHFHYDTQDGNDTTPLLNKLDNLDDKVDGDGAATNSPTTKVRPPTAVAAVVSTPRKHRCPCAQKWDKKAMGLCRRR